MDVNLCTDNGNIYAISGRVQKNQIVDFRRAHLIRPVLGLGAPSSICPVMCRYISSVFVSADGFNEARH